MGWEDDYKHEGVSMEGRDIGIRRWVSGPLGCLTHVCRVSFPRDKATRGIKLHTVLIIKPTRCTNLSKFIFGIKLYMFRTVPLSTVRSFSPYIQQWYMAYRFADSLRAGSGRNHQTWNGSLTLGLSYNPSVLAESYGLLGPLKPIGHFTYHHV